MKKKILSLLLVLCMVVCLLPMTAFAAAETAGILYYDAYNNDITKTVNNDGTPRYFYTNDNGLVVEGIAGTYASEADYNIKLVYPADGVPTVYLRDVTINHPSRVGLQIGASGDTEDFAVIIESDSTIENQADSNPVVSITTTGDVTFTSVDNAKLTVTANKYNDCISATAGGDLAFVNANVKLDQVKSRYNTGILLKGHNLTVDASVLEINTLAPGILLADKNLNAANWETNTTGTPRDMFVKNGSVLTVAAMETYQPAIYLDGTLTVENSSMTLTKMAGWPPCLRNAPTIVGGTVTGKIDGSEYSITHTHVADADDKDCTTPTACTCGYEMAAAEAAHVAAEDDGDCTTDILCANDGCEQVVTAGAAAHVAGQDDGDCTTAVKCTNCDADAIAAKEHEAEDGDFECSEDVPCKNCDKLFREAGDHFGGEATCKAKAKCESCGEEYGELGACKPADDDDCTTAVKCSVCGKETTAAKSAHTYTDNKDTSCDNAGCTHTRKVEGTENPKTADATVLAPLFVLLAVSLFGFAIVLNKKKIAE